MSGLAEYINLTPCPYPPIVAQWEGIPVQQVQSFTPPDFQRSDCFCGNGMGCFCNNGMGSYIESWNTGLQRMGPGGGLGAFAWTSPDGYFASGMDFTQWGLAEGFTVLAGIYLVFSALWTTKSAVDYASQGRKRASSRKKRMKKAEESRGFF